MTIEKLEEFASNGDKHLTGLDVATGFPRADKPERPWFNKLFGDITGKINEVVDSIDGLPPFEDGVLPTTKASYLNTAIGAVNRVLHDKLEDSVSVADFGADPSKPDNYQAFFDCFNAFPDRAALDITIPIGTYKLSKTLYVTRPHTIRGIGGLENPMSVLDFTGAALDDNNGIKGGLWFHHLSNPHVTLPVGQVGDYGAGAIVSGVGVVKSSSDGFVINAPITLNDSFGYNNGREGVYLYGGTQGGNANHTNISRCKFAVNGGSGIKAEGSDGNTFTVTGCALMNNSEYGFNDQSLLGGVVIGCEADGNALANYNMRGGAQDNSGLVVSPSRTAFIACYSESHPIANYSLSPTGVVIGGTGAPADSGTAIMSSLAGLLSLRGIVVSDNEDVAYSEATPFAKMDKAFLRLGLDASRVFKINPAGGNYQIGVEGAASAILLRYDADINEAIKKERPWFQNGLTISAAHYQIAKGAMPTTGAAEKGAICWNEKPAAGGHVGWVCVTGGATPTWKPFGKIEV